MAQQSPEVVLVLGGTRSGKSDWARHYVENRYRKPVFLATARDGDAEMEARIARHRRERGGEWGLVEEPMEIAAVLTDPARRPGADAILVDCLTMWLTNIVLTEGETAVERRTAELLAALRDPPCSVVLVANEVGMGIVPEHELGRWFRDAAGRLNQQVAGLARRAVLVIAGLALDLKNE
ncbi:MAG: bifunctional adenosylcobinamide kinase/adenosylcobinamide-phosphate guanylyltransferase [Thermoanaerobacterales bacterium]|nr:bifunctional adenosylcobinamide kinase/adenosylcobinamide-phosphate guanylyltransferase [Bacillota bacterium]MDI6906970.1 bifunctional adenosylcobinamide kinase/adenosylcobinamide-phosphate guanylyltransferase [Thermoanaerobacterales bacterium]